MEGFSGKRDPIRDLEHSSGLKASVYGAAIDILPETLIVYGYGAHYDDMKVAIENALVESGATDERGLLEAAERALEDYLEKHEKNNPEFGRTFLSKVKLQMGAE